eukprot:scaffold11162_cov113-Isochrysis_galbana.AAC.4
MAAPMSESRMSWRVGPICLIDGDQIFGVGDELGVVPLFPLQCFNAISSGRGHWRGLVDTLLRMGRGWRSEIESF